MPYISDKKSKTRHPEWLTVRAPRGEGFESVNKLVAELGLHTVCQSANCPNLGECWNRKTATFMILGDICTRNCQFCAVEKGIPMALDNSEALRVANAVKRLGLRFAVITSVTRDDLIDGGASIFAEVISKIREQSPSCGIEVLIPDFEGNIKALETVVRAGPDVLNHNLETIRRLYSKVRPKADYNRSLEILKISKEFNPSILTKSGIMIGLGETRNEITELLKNLRSVNCDALTVGQYLSPTPKHLPIAKYYPPEEFEEIKKEAKELGFIFVESGPLVRSSYKAHMIKSETSF